MANNNKKSGLPNFGFYFYIRRNHSVDVTQAVAACGLFDPEKDYPLGIPSYRDNSELNGLQIAAYFSDYNDLGLNDPSIEVDHSLPINLSKAEEIAELLRKVNKALNRQRESQGRELSFGQLVARVCAIFGFEHIWIENQDRDNGSPKWRHYHNQIGSAVDAIDYQVRCEQSKRKESRQKAA